MLLFILTACSSPSKPLQSTYIEPSQHEAYFNATPASHEDDQHLLGTAGVVIYALLNEKPYLLLGKEKKEETYSPFAGRMRINNGASETYVETALRELDEESARLYLLKRSDLKSCKAYFEMSPNKRGILLIFVRSNEIKRTKDLIEAQASWAQEAYLEKTDLQWVPIKALLANSTAPEITVDGGVIVRFRDTFYNMLQQSEFRKILMDIDRRD